MVCVQGGMKGPKIQTQMQRQLKMLALLLNTGEKLN